MADKKVEIVIPDRDDALIAANVGANFLLELIEKYETERKQLSKNLDLYQEKGLGTNYDQTFSSWNRCNLFIWDLKDVLCRMGIDID